ncbi:MAG: NUDIX domain-containing protein [Ilumatobacteraceae bacterium]
MSAIGPLRIREAVRALVIDTDDRVLLVRFDFPDRSVWAPPGGGIDPGEAPHDALRRELGEEIGLDDPDIGPHLWNRLHVFAFLNGMFDGQRDQTYLVRVPAGFEPRPMFTWAQLNAEYVFDMRWWTLTELRAADIVTAPIQLASLLEDVLINGAPDEPLSVEA